MLQSNLSIPSTSSPSAIPSPSLRQIDPTFSTYSKRNHISPFPLLPPPLLPSSWPGWLQSLPHWILCCHPPHSTHTAASLSTLPIIGPLFHFTELWPQRSCQTSSLPGIWQLQLVPALDMPNCAFNLNSSSSENDQQIPISSERHPKLTNLKSSPSPFYHIILLHLTT